MKCICKLRVDKLRRCLSQAQVTVAGLETPNLSKLEDLAKNAPENAMNNASVSDSDLDFSPISKATLSASEEETVSNAAKLSSTANMKSTMETKLGVNITSPSAPKALGGIIHAAQVSGLIDVLNMAANFQGLHALGATASSINLISHNLGINLLEDALACDALDDMDRICDPDNSSPDDETEESPHETMPEQETPEDLENKRDDELPGMIGDSIRKLNEYIKENPGVSKTSIADAIIESLGDSLFLGLEDIDLNELVNKAILSVHSDFADKLLEEEGDLEGYEEDIDDGDDDDNDDADDDDDDDADGENADSEEGDADGDNKNADGDNTGGSNVANGKEEDANADGKNADSENENAESEEGDAEGKNADGDSSTEGENAENKSDSDENADSDGDSENAEGDLENTENEEQRRR